MLRISRILGYSNPVSEETRSMGEDLKLMLTFTYHISEIADADYKKLLFGHESFRAGASSISDMLLEFN
jgi:hypothetical protein